VEYNLRIRKKRKRKNKCTLSNHPAPFFSMVGHLNTENCTNMMFMEEATQKNDYQESVCCIVYRNKGNVRTVRVFPFRRFRL
jgi:hypothetical protein